MSLHNQIMELPTQDRHLEDWSNTRMAWLAGFDTGLHEAAHIAKEADELMAEMAEALSLYVKAGHGMSTDFQQQGDARQSALYALDKYKETIK